jgi:cullin-associated NEDD8-dissociated protein 1
VSEWTLDQDHPQWFSKAMVWSTVAMNGADQLWQRIAWALSEIFIFTESDIEKEQLTKPWAIYYDIFARHAFGNFCDVLK